MINNGYYQIGTNTQRSSSNMEGGIKVLYGIIGGIQTLIHIISSSLDVYYFGKEFKSLVIDSLIQLSGFCVKLIKYIASFQWITDALYNVQYFQNKYSFIKYNTMRIYFRIGIIVILLLLLLSKKRKEKQYINNNNIL